MNPQLARVRHDLEVLTTASGLGQPPLGREDVWAFRAIGITGALWSAWSWIGLPSPPLAVLGLIGSLLVVVVYHFAYARGSSRTTTRDRIHRGSWWLGLVLGLLIGGFFIWARFIAAMDPATFVGSLLLFSGGLLVLLAATEYWRLFFGGWGVPLLVLGAGLRFLPTDAFSVLLGVAVAIGGLASSTIVSSQLKAARR